jgi:curved DNA-binding protein
MVLKVMIILIFFESMFAGQGGRARTANYKGQDFNAELHLELKEVYSTHKRTLTINGKNIRPIKLV